MKICVMSDLHGLLPDALEKTELTIIAGDIVPLAIQRNIHQSKKWIKSEFAHWAKNWPSDTILFIAGNHDFVFEASWEITDALELNEITDGKACYLAGDNVFEYYSESGQIYRIFGTPYCHEFGNWAFMYSDEELADFYEQIPNDCDIIFSHDAADINNLGLVPPNIWHPNESLNAGNKVLAEYILKNNPKYYFCGHIHEGNHKVETIDNITMANVSILNDAYQFTYEPLYLDI